jgi:hypothetical protein
VNPLSPPQRMQKRRAAREAMLAKARHEGMPLKVEASARATSKTTQGPLDPTLPAKKTLVFGEYATTPTAHWSSDRPLKKAVSKFLLGQSCNQAAPR